MKALHRRGRDREAANAVQREIAKMAELPKLSLGDQDAFTTRFRNLITSGDGHDHLWHSGDIHRRGQAALKHPKKTIAFFALAEIAARLPVEEGYAKLRKSAGAIEGVGINMVSEILCTFAPTRYARVQWKYCRGASHHRSRSTQRWELVLSGCLCSGLRHHWCSSGTDRWKRTCPTPTPFLTGYIR